MYKKCWKIMSGAGWLVGAISQSQSQSINFLSVEHDIPSSPVSVGLEDREKYPSIPYQPGCDWNQCEQL